MLLFTPMCHIYFIPVRKECKTEGGNFSLRCVTFTTCCFPRNLILRKFFFFGQTGRTNIKDQEVLMSYPNNGDERLPVPTGGRSHFAVL